MKENAAILAAAGLLAGGMNAIAGGGSFVSFPAMVLAGLPPVIANAPLPLWRMLPLTVAGGCAGAALLLATPGRLLAVVWAP